LFIFLHSRMISIYISMYIIQNWTATSQSNVPKQLLKMWSRCKSVFRTPESMGVSKLIKTDWWCCVYSYNAFILVHSLLSCVPHRTHRLPQILNKRGPGCDFTTNFCSTKHGWKAMRTFQKKYLTGRGILKSFLVHLYLVMKSKVGKAHVTREKTWYTRGIPGTYTSLLIIPTPISTYFTLFSSRFTLIINNTSLLLSSRFID
jgi:hypothetical protein